MENRVGVVRKRFFTPRLKFKSYEDLNAYLLDRCIAYVRSQPHPEQKDKTVFAAFEAERSALIPCHSPFDGFHATSAAVSKTCLIRFDCNRYSVTSSGARRPVDVHAYADRIDIKQDGIIVGEHRRRFGCDQIAYDPGAGEEARRAVQWRTVQGLAAAGRAREGAPQAGRSERLSLTINVRSDDGDRQMVKILTAVPTDGLQAVEAACAEALAAGLVGADVILSTLARRQQEAPALPIATPARLALSLPPIADCARYDRLRSPAPEAAYGAL